VRGEGVQGREVERRKSGEGGGEKRVGGGDGKEAMMVYPNIVVGG